MCLSKVIKKIQIQSACFSTMHCAGSMHLPAHLLLVGKGYVIIHEKAKSLNSLSVFLTESVNSMYVVSPLVLVACSVQRPVEASFNVACVSCPSMISALQLSSWLCLHPVMKDPLLFHHWMYIQSGS